MFDDKKKKYKRDVVRTTANNLIHYCNGSIRHAAMRNVAYHRSHLYPFLHFFLDRFCFSGVDLNNLSICNAGDEEIESTLNLL